MEHPEISGGHFVWSCIRGLQDMQNLGNKYRFMALNHSEDR